MNIFNYFKDLKYLTPQDFVQGLLLFAASVLLLYFGAIFG